MNALCNSCKKHLTCTAFTKEFKRLQLAILSRHRNCVPGYRNCVMERFRLKALIQAQVTPSEEWLLANVKTRAAWERGWKRCDVYCRWVSQSVANRTLWSLKERIKFHHTLHLRTSPGRRVGCRTAIYSYAGEEYISASCLYWQISWTYSLRCFSSALHCFYWERWRK